MTEFRHYLLGKQFELLVDHCPLCVLEKKIPTSSRIRRWAIILSKFNFTVTYTRGSLHQDIDRLSRAPVDDAVDSYQENRLYRIAAPADLDSWKSKNSDDESKVTSAS